MRVRSSSGSRGSAPVSSCSRSQTESGGGGISPAAREEKRTVRRKARDGSPCSSCSSSRLRSFSIDFRRRRESASRRRASSSCHEAKIAGSPSTRRVYEIADCARSASASASLSPLSSKPTTSERMRSTSSSEREASVCRTSSPARLACWMSGPRWSPNWPGSGRHPSSPHCSSSRCALCSSSSCSPRRALVAAESHGAVGGSRLSSSR
mmetsp:Transcript_38257/g.113714  ORF Transcript_38257/g.113714 Transcript_38257/m.113714 type:complete len:209 (-) Transcript_38257:250-876(-)